MKNTLILFCLGMFFPLVAAQQKDDSKDVQIWAVPAEHKVRPLDKPQTTNLVWSADKKQINISGAGNEHVAFQVVVSVPVPPGWRPKAPDGFFVTTSELTSSDGKKIPQGNINLYFEHYILVYAKSSPVGETGYWPDALAPLKDPFSMQAQFSVLGNRPVWIDVYIPEGTPKGIYNGKVTITRHGKEIGSMNVSVDVYGFSLPEETHLITYMNISKSEIARFYNKPATTPEMEKTIQNYFDFLHQHRMETWFNDPLVPEITIKGDAVQLKFNEQRYDQYMNKLKIKRVILEAGPNEITRHVKSETFTPELNKLIKSYITQVASYFKKNGWSESLVFNSPIDEPNTKEDYEKTRKWAELVHEAAPGVPFLSTESPIADNPEWGTLRGYVNNFCVHGNSLNEPEVKQALREEQEKGGEATWYISCDQTYPQPNYFIDAPALDPVMVPWITERYKMNGFLYWAANFWIQTPDPWLDPVTYISGFECSGGYVLNGEGSLIYPGNHTKTYTGQPDVDGAVSSIRFELLRDGIEDYEYIWLLKNNGAADFAEKIVNNMVIDVSTFSRNLEELYISRKEMARKLEEILKK